jgi:hypothetical protein
MDWIAAFGLVGLFSLVVMLILFGLLSKRMARATKTPSYYIGFYVAAFFLSIGVFVRLIYLTGPLALSADMNDNIGWVLLYNGAPALGLTLGVIFSWRYWSWLLAERS